jgi:hypothetical protein
VLPRQRWSVMFPGSIVSRRTEMSAERARESLRQYADALLARGDYVSGSHLEVMARARRFKGHVPLAALAGVLAIGVLLLSLAGAPASYAATTVYRGAFKCASDRKPLARARIELWQTHVRWLPEVPPNFRHRNTTRADENGAWGFTVSGDESNWRIRLVLVGEHARVQDWPWPWNWFTHTLRSQNNVPLRDYGTQVVSGYQCDLYTGFSQAARDYHAEVGSPPPQGVTVARAGAPTAGSRATTSGHS